VSWVGDDDPCPLCEERGDSLSMLNLINKLDLRVDALVWLLDGLASVVGEKAYGKFSQAMIAVERRDWQLLFDAQPGWKKEDPTEEELIMRQPADVPLIKVTPARQRVTISLPESWRCDVDPMFADVSIISKEKSRLDPPCRCTGLEIRTRTMPVELFDGEEE